MAWRRTSGAGGCAARWCGEQVRRSVLFTGASGVGKSAVVLDTLSRLAPVSELLPVVLNFSAQTNSMATQVRAARVVLPQQGWCARAWRHVAPPGVGGCWRTPRLRRGLAGRKGDSKRALHVRAAGVRTARLAAGHDRGQAGEEAQAALWRAGRQAHRAVCGRRQHAAARGVRRAAPARAAQAVPGLQVRCKSTRGLPLANSIPGETSPCLSSWSCQRV